LAGVFFRGRPWLRPLGAFILVFGLGSAAIVYWLGTKPEDLSADPATARAYKNDARNIEINSGKTGAVIHNLLDESRQPAGQAALIAAGSILVGGGCIYFGKLANNA